MKRKWKMPFLSVLFCCVIVLVWGLTQTNRIALVGDEIYSFGLSNGNEGAFYYQDLYYERCGVGGWLPGTELENWMEVGDKSPFSYQYVWANQAEDVHPPLYYAFLHTICSVAKYSHSRVLGLLINLVAAFFLFLGLFRWEQELLKQRGDDTLTKHSWLPGFFLLMLPGTWLVFRYLRMYTMLMAECVWFSYLLYQILGRKEIKRKQVLMLFLTVVMGGLTHYFFYVYAFFIALFVGIAMIIRKAPWRMIVRYTLTLLTGVALDFVLFPTSYFHLFGSYRAKDLQNNISSVNTNLQDYLEQMSNWICPAVGIILILILVMLILVRKLIYIDKNLWIIWSGVTIATLLIIRSAVTVSFYYVAPLYAFIAIGLADIALQIWSREKQNRIAGILMVAVCALLLGSVVRFNIQERRNATNQVKAQEALEAIGKADVYFVQRYSYWDNIFDGWLEQLSQFDEWTIGHEEEFPEGWFFKVAGDRVSCEDPLLILIRTGFWDEQGEDLKEQFSLVAEYNGYYYLRYEE